MSIINKRVHVDIVSLEAMELKITGYSNREGRGVPGPCRGGGSRAMQGRGFQGHAGEGGSRDMQGRGFQ